MFTGIVEEVGKIQKVTSNKLIVECQTVLDGSKRGDSIAVNGVCLTVTAIGRNYFEADISPETQRICEPFKLGGYVNLERAMSVNGRFGGHIVSGHIDGRGRCSGIEFHEGFYNLAIELDKDLLKYVIYKGSISINGISLTVAEINNNSINLAIIPHSFEYTNLKYLKKNDFVNIETDILAKYIEKFLSTGDNRSRLDLAFLSDNGFI